MFQSPTFCGLGNPLQIKKVGRGVGIDTSLRNDAQVNTRDWLCGAHHARLCADLLPSAGAYHLSFESSVSPELPVQDLLVPPFLQGVTRADQEKERRHAGVLHFSFK
jgi:hypothetical protein